MSSSARAASWRSASRPTRSTGRPPCSSTRTWRDASSRRRYGVASSWACSKSGWYRKSGMARQHIAALRVQWRPVSAPQTPRPSGTVVVVRDAAPGFELLLLERTPRDGEPQPWVFPGGKVDAADLRAGEDEVAAARRAAAREAHEEAGLVLEVESFVPISRWITPEISPNRFDTWFFLAPLRSRADVRVDGGEIQGHRWLSPREALALHEQKVLRLAPPTYVTVTTLSAYAGVEPALRGCAACELS